MYMIGNLNFEQILAWHDTKQISQYSEDTLPHDVLSFLKGEINVLV